MSRLKRSWRLRLLLPIPMLSLLAGCGTPAPASEPTVTTNPCRVIALKTYDRAFNSALADEVEQASPGAVWPRAISDYAGLRDGVRACQALR